MKRQKTCISVALSLLLIAALFLVCGCQTMEKGARTMNTDGKKGILVVSFGTSFPETRARTIEACEQKITEAFPDYEVRRAFTSHIIIDVLKKRDNIRIDKPGEALEKMYADGFSEVIVQPLHIIPGEEFHEKILAEVQAYRGAFEKCTVGMPILSSTEDFRRVISALETQIPALSEDEAVVLMGHGTHHPANSNYAALQYMFMMEEMNIFVGTVEGSPTLDDVVILLKKNNIRKVTLMPFMLVAGDHASNDMAGDEEDSWKSILEAAGYKVDSYLHGLGENEIIQDMYVSHIRDVMAD